MPSELGSDGQIRRVGPASTETEVVVASSTVATTNSGVAIGEPSERVVRGHLPVERWAAVSSAVVGTVTVLAGLLLGAAAAYAYGDPAACAAYAKAHHGARGFGCTAWQRQAAIMLPMLGLPVLVVAALAWIWIPDRTGRVRVKQVAALLGLLATAIVLASLGIRAAV